MRRGDAAFLPVLLAATVWAYLPALPAPPAYDDSVIPMLAQKAATPSALLAGFLSPCPPAPAGVPLPPYAYRPLTEASFVLNGALAGRLGIPGLRLGNLGIHLAAALLVFALARRLGTEDPAFARLAALFFALHPVAVEAVTYVYQRATSLEALALFGTVLLYGRARRTGSRRWYAGALGAGLLAMTAKETAVTLPLVLGALEWIGRTPGEPGRRALGRWLPFAVLAALPLVQFLRASREAAALLPAGPGGALESGFRPAPGGATPLEYLLLELPILLRYAVQALLPFPLRFYDDRVLPLDGKPYPIPATGTALSALALAMLLGWILLGPRRHALPRLGSALFLAPLALESSVFPIQDLAFTHRCYPGLLGAALVFAWAASRAGRPLAVGALVLLAAGTLHQNRLWASPPELLRRDVRHAFHRTAIWGNYAWQYQELGKPAAAERLLRHALRSPWQNPRTLLGMASVLASQGRLPEAAQAYDRALAAFPQDATVLWLAVLQALASGDAARADALDRRAGGLPVLRPELALWLACRRLEEGSPGRAQAVLERQLRHYPTHPQLLDLLGRALQVQGRLAEAEALYRRALALDPGMEQTRRDLESLGR